MPKTDAFELEAQAARLRRAREAAGFRSARLFAIRHGLTESTYYAYESGRRRLTRQAAAEIAPLLGVEPDYLRFGKPSGTFTDNGNLSETVKGLKPVPLIDVSDTSTIKKLLTGHAFMPDHYVPMPPRIAGGERSFAVNVADDALSGAEPRPVVKGNIAYLDPDQSFATGDIVAALIEGLPRLVLRQFRELATPDGDSAYELVCSNPLHQPFSSLEHRIRIVGRLIGLWVAFD